MVASSANTMTLIAEFYMKDDDDTNSWDAALGTGLTGTAAFGCTSSTLTNLSSTETLACTLTAAGSISETTFAEVKITNFATINSGDVVDIKFLI